jgi:hypothetical protein
MYVERARSNVTTAREVASIAKLISQLPGEELQSGAWQAISADESLPALIRLAGYQLGDHPVEASAMRLLAPILRAAEGEVDHWEQLIADDFFWNIQGARNEFISLVGAPLVQDRVVFSLIMELFKVDYAPTERQEILRSAIGVAVDRRIKFQIMLAIAGDEVAAADLIDKLDEVSDEIVHIWCFNANHFSEVNSIRAIQKLKQRKSIPIFALSSLLTGITYKMEPSLDCGGVLDNPNRHPIYQSFIEWIDEVLKDDQQLPLNQRCQAARLKKELGHGLTFEEVDTLLRASWDAYLALDSEENVFNVSWQVESCIDVMDTEMYVKCHSLLQEIACSEAPNANRRALTALALMGDLKELEWMAAKYGEIGGDIGRNIFETAERLAARLGKRIVRDEDNLRIEDW